MRLSSVLLLCRTPLQSVIIKQILHEEQISSYDLVYLTQDNSEEDKHYYNELSWKAEYAQYIFVDRQKYDIFNHFKIYNALSRIIKKNKYNTIIISSIDNLSFRKILIKNKNAFLISFDDGTGHINLSYQQKKNIKTLAYEFAFRVKSQDTIKKRIFKHYSIYRKFDNIMPNNILKYIDLFSDNNNFPIIQKKIITIFIGQPFYEYCNISFIENLRQYVSENNFDYYVKHPRESDVLVNSIPLLPKNGKIAEEVLYSICKDSRILIVGCFSSVLININTNNAQKIMIIDKHDPFSEYYSQLGIDSNCEVIRL